ncbi:MAG: D-sedoheptulose 7-phosphate isomerase [Bacteroidales bacterium]|nr:D-sedoheptulose 7-phosphate isomerase [Bacteroidales bacterium]
MDSSVITARLEAHIGMMKEFESNEALKASLLAAAEMIESCFRAGGKVYFCGNGGSAADAQHIAAELSGRFYFDRESLPAEALHCNTSYLTAVANDYSFDIIYSRLIAGLGRPGDVLVGLSTSGNSKNILMAFEECRSKGIRTIAFTGATGGSMKELADVLVNVPSNDTPRIQEAHITAGHIVCEMVEQAIFGK